jgi:glyoxylase-like metal-dependent hydrolase (beta-lactamase superfamily II)
MRLMRQIFQPLASGVFAVDTEHVRPRVAASYLIVDDGHAAFVDTGTYFSVPNFLETLAALGLEAGAVDYVLLTHVHLDHAGGAGRLAAALPHARVAVHPRGVAHLKDPAKLIAATKAVYGEKHFAAEFGDIVPIAAERLVIVEDGRRLELGRRTLEIVHTPGHALHHVCILDRDAREVFAGDTFGVSYRETDTAAGEFIFPTTSPAQFDPIQLRASIRRIALLEPKSVYVTHFGRVTGIDKLARDLLADVDAFVRIARDAAPHPDRARRMRGELFGYLCARLDAHGFASDERLRHAVLDGDVALNAAGLDAWLTRIA